MNDTEDTPRECFACGTQFTGTGVQLFIALRESTLDYDAQGRTTGFTSDVLCVECGKDGRNYWPRHRYEARVAERARARQDATVAALLNDYWPPEPGASEAPRLIHHAVDDTYTLEGLHGFTLSVQDNGRVRLHIRDRSVHPDTAALIAWTLRMDAQKQS